MMFTSSDKAFVLFFVLYFLTVCSVIYLFISKKERIRYESPLQTITENIQTPVSIGENQYGSAKWLDKKSFDIYFPIFHINPKNDLYKTLIKNGFDDLSFYEKGADNKKQKEFKVNLLEKIAKKAKKQSKQKNNNIDNLYKIQDGGLALGLDKSGDTENIYYVKDDTHSLVIGSTRSGKTRSIVLQTIGIETLAGESMIISDPKGEIYNYTAPFLEKNGYEVLTIDFKNPLKSSRYNFLQSIIDTVNDGNIPKAIDQAWDLTTSLVGEPTGEKIWTDGAASIIAASILAVVYDNQDSPEFQNMSNVYYFIANMCKQDSGAGGSAMNNQSSNKNGMPLNDYIKSLSDHHPARALLGISEVAPSRTKGSFFTQALTNIQLFANDLIYDMTSQSDFDIRKTGINKRALFIILPDEKETYYPLASLFVSQHYETLVNVADNNGGRLQRRVNFLIDEFGNFATIPYFGTKLTVGGGRGIRFNLFLQSVSQLTKRYGKEVAQLIKGNCHTWIYLQADDNETLEEISKKLGNYTVSSGSISSSYQTGQSSSESASYSLISRPLLTADEIGKINRPHTLVLGRNDPSIMNAPDISQYYFNQMFGMGDEKHNSKLRKEREDKRSSRSKEVLVKKWNIWKMYDGSMAEDVENNFNRYFREMKDNQMEEYDD